MWINRWVGIPYKECGRGPDGYDCLGLFLAIQKERFDRELPDPACTMLEAVKNNVVESLKPLARHIRVPGEVREGDALLFAVGQRTLHLGYAVSSYDMLHVEKYGLGSVVEKWNGGKWLPSFRGAYRLA